MSGIHERLAKAAGRSRRLRFDDFQRVALYDPEFGYFSRSATRAGRDGDFLTSPEVAPLFAEVVAKTLSADAATLATDEFHVIEVGAGRGRLARDLWEAWRFDPVGRKVRLHLVEASAAARAEQAKTLADVPKDRWHSYADAAELPSFDAGAIVANELFDNLPVRRVMMAEALKEIVVHVRKDGLREELVEAPVDLTAYLEAQGVRLFVGQTAEICLEAPKLLASLLTRLGRGSVLIVDYGDEAKHLYATDRFPHGTLAAHRGHTTHTDLYRSPGEQDLTSHVNFTPLLATLEAAGYRRLYLGTQMRFLLEHGLPEILERRRARANDDFERLRWNQWAKQLYHPEAMGEAFRVLHARTP
ncbi:MAG: SAM-dependent methyltransferase [Euryarchaeota archaeon]|nr:SAM-dependent methyltransferase [Euryarchaeota archaeon]